MTVAEVPKRCDADFQRQRRRVLRDMGTVGLAGFLVLLWLSGGLDFSSAACGAVTLIASWLQTS